ncbi:hypothetical protein ABPG73_018878 [Tetrahymena malaccensis]
MGCIFDTFSSAVCNQNILQYIINYSTQEVDLNRSIVIKEKENGQLTTENNDQQKLNHEQYSFLKEDNNNDKQEIFKKMQSSFKQYSLNQSGYGLRQECKLSLNQEEQSSYSNIQKNQIKDGNQDQYNQYFNNSKININLYDQQQYAYENYQLNNSFAQDTYDPTNNQLNLAESKIYLDKIQFINNGSKLIAYKLE